MISVQLLAKHFASEITRQVESHLKPYLTGKSNLKEVHCEKLAWCLAHTRDCPLGCLTVWLKYFLPLLLSPSSPSAKECVVSFLEHSVHFTESIPTEPKYNQLVKGFERLMLVQVSGVISEQL